MRLIIYFDANENYSIIFMIIKLASNRSHVMMKCRVCFHHCVGLQYFQIETDLEEIEDIQVSSSIEASLTLDSPDQRSRVKASDWMKSLDLETPTKQSPSNLIPMGDDSAKKKKKYSRYICQ